MTAALLAAVVVVVVVAVGAVGALRRRSLDERSSVRDYQQTLETLRHLSDRRTAAAQEAQAQAARAAQAQAARAAQAEAAREAAQAEAAREAAQAQAAQAASNAQRECTPELPPTPAAPAARSAWAAPAASVPAGADGTAARGISNGRPRQRQRTTTLLASSGSRNRRAAAYATRTGPPAISMRVEAPPEVLAAADVVEAPPTPKPTSRPSRSPNRISAADAVRELAAATNLHGSRPAARSMPGSKRPDRRPLIWTVAAVIVTGAVTGVAVAEAPSHSSPPSRSAAATTVTTGAGHHTRTPTKTAPSRSRPGGLDPVTSSTTAATYQVASAPYTVTVGTTTGPCWVEATNAATGQLLWEGTLPAGASQAIPASGGLVLRLGNSLVATVSEEGQAVHLPPGAADVFDLLFEIV